MPSKPLKQQKKQQQRNKNKNKIIRMKENGSNKHNNKQKTTTNDKNENKKHQQQPNMPTNIKVKQFLQIQQQFQQNTVSRKKTSTINPVSARGSTLFGAFTSAWKPKALPSMPGFKDPLTLNVSSWCGGNIGKIGVFVNSTVFRISTMGRMQIYICWDICNILPLLIGV